MTCPVNFNRKIFLTKSPVEFGSLAYRIKNETFKDSEGDTQPSILAKLRLTDCKDAITLNFNIASQQDYEYMLNKVDTLSKEVESFKEKLLLATKHFQSEINSK